MIDQLLREMQREIDDLTLRLQDGDITVAAWTLGMERIIARFQIAAWTLGGSDNDGRAQIEIAVQEQIDYLDNFAAEVEAQIRDGWRASWNARARMYAGSVKPTYWDARTYGIPLPAQPAQGTQCLTNCLCSWRIVTLSGNGNYDATWVRHADDSCQTCIQRGADWSPLRIRGGQIQ